MPNPPPIQCSAPGCQYSTPDNLATIADTVTLISLHTQQAHPAPAPQAPAAAPKLEKLPRPTFTLNMTESKWNFTVLSWNNYIGQSPTAPEATKLMQLQAACDEELKQRVYDNGNFDTLNTTALFLAKMKELAVITVHKSVHLMNLWRMIQEPEESIRAFVARVTSTADMCGMSIHCQTCDTDLSYRDNVVQQVIIHGMRDNDVRVRVLSRNTAGELTNLKKLVDYIAAEEAGISESLNLNQNTVGSIRRSSYKKSQQTSSQASPAGNCGHCGERKHSDREKQCRAFGTQCNKCHKNHHFAKMCRSSARTAAALAETPDNEGSLASISSVWDSAPSCFPSSPPTSSIQ